MTFQSGHHSFEIGRELTNELMAMAHQHGCTMFMLMMAVFGIVLSRTTGQNEVVIGSPIAGRHHLGTEGLIGMLVNTLALPLRFKSQQQDNDNDQDQSTRDYLIEVRNMIIGASEHQDLPFEMLLKELDVSREANRNPLFQVMMVYLEQDSGPSLHLEGVKIKSNENQNLDVPSKFDLTCVVKKNSQGSLWIDFEFLTELYSQVRMERMGEHFVQVARHLRQWLDKPVQSIPMMTESELEKQLISWNDNWKSIQENQTVVDLFHKQVTKRWGSVAVVYGEQKMTYGELNDRANAVALFLVQKIGNVGSEHRVGLMAERSLDLVVSLLAIWKTGSAYVPLDPLLPVDRLSFMVSDSGCDLIITTTKQVTHELFSRLSFWSPSQKICN